MSTKGQHCSSIHVSHHLQNAANLSRSSPARSDGVAPEMSHVCSYMDHANSKGIWFGDNPLLFYVPSLLLQLSLINVVTKCFHFFLKPLGQPAIISQILAGVFLGPSVLGQSTTFLTNVFPNETRVVLETAAAFAFMLFIFLIGVKVDPTMVFRTGKQPLIIGILAIFVPYGLSNFVAFLLQKHVYLDQETFEALPFIVAVQCMTAFPVVACFLDDLKILNSEIGRLASSSSIICDVCNWGIMMINYTARLADRKSFRITIGSFFSTVLFLVAILYGIRPAALWAVRRTPEGRPVKEIYICAVLVTLMICGFIGELIGITAFGGSLALGLVIPDGPPLGAALEEKLDSFVHVFMPLFFAVSGLETNFSAIKHMEHVGVIQLLACVSIVGKVLGTVLPPLFLRIPVRDALSLALIMNTKGIAELGFMIQMKHMNQLTEEPYTVMVISVVVITGVISPIIKVLYDPSRRYLAYRRRTILHLRRNEELRILTCLHSPETVQAVISLLQASNATKESPITIVVLHLVKLVGRSSSLLVAHRQHEKSSSKRTQSEQIFSAFKKFEQLNVGRVFLNNTFKGISPYATMHNDVCSLALEKRSILIIVPFHKQYIYGETVETSSALENLNKKVLDKAPCSVGVLIDRVKQKNPRYILSEQLLQKVAVIFFGGADDREALAYGQRMSENPSIQVNLIRFITSDSENVVGGKERSKMLDAKILSDFKHSAKTTSCKQVSYQEEEVSSGKDVVALTRSVGDANDLVLVGRRHGESDIMHQLKEWRDRGELGAVGEILASPEHNCAASVLVLQQQTKLWGLQDPEESTHLRKCDL
ncbi:hypothetical protein AgCh_038807 [Apium graveolens]